MYPKWTRSGQYNNALNDYAKLKYEYGAAGMNEILEETEAFMKAQLEKMQALAESADVAAREPNCLKGIQALRKPAERKLWTSYDDAKYRDRLAGALIGRMAGCTLGAPVEFWSIEAMENWAKWIGDEFPNKHFWSLTKSPNDLRYGMSPCHAYSLAGLDGVPVDDDVTYTLLGLLIAEDHGINFDTEGVGKAWVKYLPYACTAEEVALNNLKKGVAADIAGEQDNPFVQWIGADIRSDPFGYMAPGLPEKAAEMAYYDAYISHRRNGIYGEMFFSAAIAAAFAKNNTKDALEAAMNEIPADCALYRDLVWAFETAPSITGYRHAREVVDKKFDGMSGVHTNNNAALCVFGLQLGGDCYDTVIGQTVAMGLDNDCTGATVGSLFGAAYGIDAIPKKWYEKFNNKILTYMIDQPEFKIDDVINRFAKLAAQQF